MNTSNTAPGRPAPSKRCGITPPGGFFLPKGGEWLVAKKILNGPESASRPWMPFYAAKWISDPGVRAMTLSAQGIYINMIAACWIHREIPGDPRLSNPSATLEQYLSNTFAVQPQHLRNAWATLRQHFRSTSPGFMVNTLVDKILQEFDDPNFSTEKRREDERREDDDDAPSDAKIASEPIPPEPPVSVPEELKNLSLYAADPKLCRRFPDLLPSWRTAFPGIVLLDEIAKAHAWEVANPSRRKRDRARFLNTWLNKAQDAPRIGSATPSINLEAEQRRKAEIARKRKENEPRPISELAWHDGIKGLKNSLRGAATPISAPGSTPGTLNRSAGHGEADSGLPSRVSKSQQNQLGPEKV